MSETKSTFETLEVWIKSRDLRNKISKLAKQLPLIRVSRSVTANISEGYGRFHYQENIQFCRQARGSIFEFVDHLTVALDEKFINEKIFKNL